MFYKDYGVSSQKNDVHEAIENVSKGLYPTAFCKVIPDIIFDENYCCIMHSDGAGTKSLLAYMMWKETENYKYFEGVAQDALVMNIDDVLCVGSPQSIFLSTTIGRNAKKINKIALKSIIQAFEQLSIQFSEIHDIQIKTTGGETADLGDVIRTLLVDATIFCRLPKVSIVDNGDICEGDIIIGLSSSGQTTYENTYNSGIGSNGLTLARHALLSPLYTQMFPESLDIYSSQSSSQTNNRHYTGNYKLKDHLKGTQLTIGEALLSPTRTYAPITKLVLENYKSLVHGIIHCTGGGQTKNLHFGKSLRYVKDNLFPIPPIFIEIQKEGQINWTEMYQVFNMGHRMEFIGSKQLLGHVTKICEKFNLEARQIGYISKSMHLQGKNEVIINSPEGEIYYS